MLISSDHKAPLKPPYGAVNNPLKGYQVEVLKARAKIIAEIEQLMMEGATKNQAIGTFISKVSALPPSDPFLETLEVANHRSGSRQLISRSTLYRWLDEKEKSGMEELAPQQIFRTYKTPAWAVKLLELYGQPQKPSLAYVIEELPNHLPDDIEAPSYSQARRFLKSLSPSKANKGRMGQQEIKKLKAYVQRDTKDLWSAAIYASDGHCFDAEVAHPRHGRPFRPEITTIIDVYSRKVVGWSVSLSENTWGILDAARHAFQYHGIPDIWYVDRGKGFNNKTWDDDLTGLLARLEITKKNSLPYNSQARGIIERLHKTLWIPLAKSFQHYVGQDMDRQARLKNYRLTQRDINKANLIDWNAFLALAQAQIDAYNQKPHSTLPRIRDTETFKRRHLSPNEAWELGLGKRAFDIKTISSNNDLLIKPSVKRKTSRGLVNLFGNRYFSNDLEAWHGEFVLVEYDIHDASKVWIRSLDNQFISEALFEGNKRSFFPLAEIQKAHQRRHQRKAKRLTNKQALLDEDNGVDQQVSIPAPTVITKSTTTRPLFGDDKEWIRWLIANPQKVNNEDKSRFKALKSQQSFLFILDSLDLSIADIEDLFDD